MTSLKASVIIPCHNCEDTIGVQLEALSQQRLDQAWEIILVDNGKNLDLARCIASYQSGLPPVRLVNARDARGAAHARNVGAKTAQGELLLFVDADDKVGEGWLEHMVRALETKPFIACRMGFEDLNTPAMRRTRRPIQQEDLQHYKNPAFLPHAGGGTLGVRRGAHFKVSGFDESMTYLEDTDYCWRLQLAGYKLHFVPEAVIHCRLRETLRGNCQQAFHWGAYNVALYRKYRSCGMEHLSWKRGTLAWYGLLKRGYRMFDRRKRLTWLRNVFWQAGRLYGSVKFRLVPPQRVGRGSGGLTGSERAVLGPKPSTQPST